MMPFSTRMICALLSETSREHTEIVGVGRVSNAPYVDVVDAVIDICFTLTPTL
jgi:hypothetical protein